MYHARMAIPAASCPDGTPPDVCCDTLFLIGDRIRTVAFDAVLACADESCRREFRSYTTFGPRIEDVHGESVIVTMTDATISPTSSTAQQRLKPFAITRASYRLELRENGWPQAKASGTQIQTANAAAINEAAAHTMSHAEAMWLALLNSAANRDATARLFPLPQNHHIMQGGVSVGNLNPIGPQAYQTAWSVDITVDAIIRPRRPDAGS